MQVPVVVHLSMMHMAYSFGAVCPESHYKPSTLVIPCTHANQVMSAAFCPVCCTLYRSHIICKVIRTDLQPVVESHVWTMTVTAAVVHMEWG